MHFFSQPFILCGSLLFHNHHAKDLIQYLKKKVISFLGCMMQFYLFWTCAVTEVFLLIVMAYDHFSAICSPLLYMDSMSQKL